VAARYAPRPEDLGTVSWQPNSRWLRLSDGPGDFGMLQVDPVSTIRVLLVADSGRMNHDVGVEAAIRL